jgi:hypothetical protein
LSHCHRWFKYGFQGLVMAHMEQYPKETEDSVLADFEFDKEPSSKWGAIGIVILWWMAYLVQAYAGLLLFPALSKTRLFQKFS